MSRGRKTAVILLSVLLVIIILAAVAILYVLGRLNSISKIDTKPIAEVSGTEQSSVQETFERDSIPVDTSIAVVQPEDISHEESRSDEWVYSDPNVINLMLIGVDGSGYSGRSDTMILLTCNKKEHTVKMTSFLRDLYVQIPGYSDNRLNAAYAFGGASLMDQVFEVNFGIHIDGHILVDFESFPKVVDALGGVDIKLTDAEAAIVGYSGAGTYHLNGTEAMNYARIRKLDSDFGRTNRQRTVLTAIYEQYGKMGWSNLLSLANQLLDIIATDMDGITLLSYGSEFMGNLSSLTQYHVPESNEYYDAVVREMMVLVPDLEAIHERLGKELYGR